MSDIEQVVNIQYMHLKFGVMCKFRKPSSPSMLEEDSIFMRSRPKMRLL